MVERTVCGGEEEDEEESNIRVESNSCGVESRCHERPEATEVVPRSANYSGEIRRSRRSDGKVIVVPPERETSRDITNGAIIGRFSLFKWFKRGSPSSWDRRERRKNSSDRKSVRESSDLDESEIASELSSSGSVETLYSTATVRSFAFRSGGRIGDADSGRHFDTARVRHFGDSASLAVGPFGTGASKIGAKCDPNDRRVVDVTKTLPASALSNRKRDITARYSLQSCNGSNGGFGSCTNFATRGNTLEGRTPSGDRRRAIRVHVRGKRRAPGPPIDARRNDEETPKTGPTKVRGKRRQAPKPPDAVLAESRVTENLTSREKSESVGVEGETGSVISSAKRETGSAISSTKERTGSAISSAKESTGSAISPAKEETGSAITSTKERIESAIYLAEEETGSAIFSAKDETGSAISPTKERTGSAIAPAKHETASAIASINKETGSASDASEATGSAASSGKIVRANATNGKEIGSEASQRNRQNGNACLQRDEIVTFGRRDTEEKADPSGVKERESPTIRSVSEKTRSGSATSTKPKRITRTKDFDGAANRGSDKTETEIKKGSPCGDVDPNEVSLKNLPSGSGQPEKSEGSQAPPADSRDFAARCDDSVVEEAKNANFTFPRDNEDPTILIGSVESRRGSGVKSEAADLAGSISNDSLVLQGGVLHSRRESHASASTLGATAHASDLKASVSRSKGRISVTTGSQTSASAMPRPWYKRSVFEHAPRESGTSIRGDVLRNSSQSEVRDVSTNSPPSAAKHHHVDKNLDGGSLGRLSFFHKHEKAGEEKRKDNKRKSGVSLLANISELDKEAAAIVQEEQARTRAASVMLRASRSSEKKLRDETVDVVQEMVTSAIETSPKRGTRALISKFNAIGNITRVTVNASFFAKSSQSRLETKLEIPKNSTPDERPEKSQFSNNDRFVRAEKDLSRYFLPTQRNTRSEEIGESERSEISSRISGNELAARLSFSQSVSSEEKKNVDPAIRESSIEAKISRSNEQMFATSERNLENSPKFSRLRINVESEESGRPEINEKTRRSRVADGHEVGKSVDVRNSEIVQKEFSNIFREIDKRLSTKESERTTKKPETASQVSRVLDILVEAEKNDRHRANLARSKIDALIAGSSVKSDSRSRIASSCEATENAMKTDLREMLKEMKHSLPKRPKPKKLSNQEILTKKDDDASKRDVKEEFFSTNEKRKEFFFSDNEKTSLLSPATITHPPTIRIGPSRDDETARSVFRANEEREYDRQKVSSAAQTSGNLRKITNLTGQNLNESAKWRNEDVIYRTSGRGIATPGTSGLTKNTFQLIRPREFAQIEAIKTMKNPNVEENTYANVMGQSMYANALVRSRKQNEPEVPRESERRSDFSGAKKLRDRDRETIDIELMDSKIAEPQNMNTLAVNRLLRKLEAAIASGHHQQAAGLAKELARLKIHCSVVRQRTKAKDVVNVNMYIEDKLAHQGPIPLRLTRSMTVGQLKAKVFTEFEIPVHVQRWIVGKDLADDDSTTLEDLKTVEGSPVFLYLVAPELKTDDTPLQDEKEVVEETPKDPELEQVNEIPEVVNVDELTEPPVECQTIDEENDEECITEEVRMERYEALISLENCDVIPNSEPIECPICFVTYGPQEGVILRDCLHMFCRPCIANTIRYCDEAEVKCPYRDTEYTCESTLQEREIKALVEPEVYQQHLAKSIAQAENNAGNNAFHCKTPDCPGWCIYDDNVNNFLCPVCGVNNCLTCQVVHKGKNCRQYQEELRLSKETDQESKRTAAMLEEMVDRGEALPCPTCAVVLMKKWGCDWLRCSMCKTEICWVTRGPRWGPGGKGDTSGGCRCGEKGVKCHPRCNYCH